MATEKVQILIDAKNNATAQLKSVNQELSRMDKAASMATRGFVALGGVMALQQAGKFAIEMAQLNTQVERSAYAFEHFSGGATQAAANLRAVQRASGGAIDSFTAQNIAVTAMTQGLASNSMELERITRIARGIVSVSPIINDLESAFSQLGLTIANQSMMRLDQLGTSAAEIKPKIEALKKANKDLTDEQAFQAALLGTLETKFASLTGAAVNQASGLERLSVAWKEYRNAASGAFAWVDTMAGGMADALDQQTKFDFGKWLAEQIGNPDVMGDLSYAQKQIVSKIKELTDLSYLDKLTMGDQYSIQIANLVDQYFKLGDAFARTSQKFDAMMNVIDPSSIQGPNLPTFFTGEDWTAHTEKIIADAEAAKEAIDKIIEAQARAAQAQAFDANGGDVQKAEAIYAGVVEQLNAWVAKQQRANVEVSTIINLLPQVAAGAINVQGAIAEIDAEPVEKLSTAISKLESATSTAAGKFAALNRAMLSSGATALNVTGAINAAADTMSEVAGDRSGAGFGKLSGMIKTPLQIGDGMKAIALESGAAASGVSSVNSEFENLKSTISGIVSGAIGPVAGVDANDLLPREDAVNENARRLADIAVNGFKGQEWLDEFALEAPDVFEQLKNSSDPKATAAQILKDFQDGLVPELIDKERAKDLVRRALQGDASTKELIDEIAADLASEFGISLGDAKAKASEVLGGDTGGATGVSLAPKIDGAAGGNAASAFAAAFTSAIEGGTLGADLSGAIFAQVTASVALIEDSGREAGRALVRGVTATFTDIPAAFIAQVAALVTPAVTAALANNGGRTGANAS